MPVSPVGLGCMGFSHAYGYAMERSEAVAMLRRAFEMGYTFFDTAECYIGLYADGSEAVNEEVVGEALEPLRDKAFIATKCGVQHLPQHRELRDSRPEVIRRSVEGSLRRLRTDCIDLYYQHRIDAHVEPETVAETMSALMREGKIRAWGISEVGEEYLRRAHAVCPVAAVQNCYSMVERWDEGFFPVLEELGVAYVSYSPLCNGLLSAHFDLRFDPVEVDHRARMRQYTPAGLEQSRGLLELLHTLAVEKNATPAQLALAWMMCKKDYIIPIPGTRRADRLQENLGAADVRLTPREIARIDEALRAMDFSPIGGTPASTNS